jgi:hypothetical protein
LVNCQKIPHIEAMSRTFWKEEEIHG